MLKKTKTVLCRCRYCGRDFLADSRHPHASCCGDAECVRAAGRERSRLYYRRLKANNPAAYAAMLARKKREKALRKARQASSAGGAPSPAKVAPPQCGSAGSWLVFAALAVLAEAASGAGDRREGAEWLAKGLLEAVPPRMRGRIEREREKFLAFAACLDPDFGGGVRGTAPHA